MQAQLFKKTQNGGSLYLLVLVKKNFLNLLRVLTLKYVFKKSCMHLKNYDIRCLQKAIASVSVI